MTDHAQGKVLGRKKWRVCSNAGPLVLAGELLQKRMLQHRYPCEYTEGEFPDALVFHSARGQPQADAHFFRVLEIAVRIVNADKRVSIQMVRLSDHRAAIILVAPHHIDDRGQLKLTKEKLSDRAKPRIA